MTSKILLIEAEPGEGCYDGSDPDLQVSEIGLSELLDRHSYELNCQIAELVAEALRQHDPQVIQALTLAGWVNKKEIKDRVEKLEMGNHYFMTSKHRSGVWYTSWRADPMNLNDLSTAEIKSLASDDSEVVRSVSKTALKKLFTGEQLAIYNKERDRLKKEKAKRAVAAKKRAETKKQKEIEKAKKILAEAGANQDNRLSG